MEIPVSIFNENIMSHHPFVVYNIEGQQMVYKMSLDNSILNVRTSEHKSLERMYVPVSHLSYVEA